MSILLGIDYGLARIGLAISRVGLAEPLFVLANDLSASSDSTSGSNSTIGPAALTKLIALLDSEKVDEIIVGISEAKMAEKIQAFVAELEKHTVLPIKLVDETLSSYEVAEKLQDLPQKHRHGPIDHYAAALILENYLELC